MPILEIALAAVAAAGATGAAMAVPLTKARKAASAREEARSEEVRGLRQQLSAAQEENARLASGVENVRAEVDKAQAAEASARAAFLVMADQIQVMARAQQAGLDELEYATEDPSLMAGLMRADHSAAQLARVAQTMAILCGELPGRQWPSATSLLDVVRGAQSRIVEYQRIQVQDSGEFAVQAPVVEALIHAVAELLDNATRYSPPTVAVVVSLRPVHSGVVIEIEDGGVGMSAAQLAETQAMLDAGGADVTAMGSGPQLGLAAVGRLGRRYNFSVSLATSAYGGVRAVVLVPTPLLAEIAVRPATPQAMASPQAPRAAAQPPTIEPTVPPAAPAPQPERQPVEEHSWADAPSNQPSPDYGSPPTNPSGLPQRETRRAPQDAVPQDAPPRRESEVDGGTMRLGVPRGLPQRRSRRGGGEGAPSAGPSGPSLFDPVAAENGRRAERTPGDAAAFMSSLQAGTRQGRDEASRAHHDHSEDRDR